MRNLRSILEKRSSILKLRDEIEEEYHNSGLPKGKSYYTKISQAEEMLCKINKELNEHGKGEIVRLTLKDRYGKMFCILLNISIHDVGLYIEHFYPELTLIGKKPVKLGELKSLGYFS